MVEIMQSHMVMSFVNVSHGTHTTPLSVTSMFMSNYPCNHLRLKYFFEVRHLGRFYASTSRASICVLPACLLLTSFLKKQDFKAARPIISYVHFLYAKLFRATAIALDLILRSVCPRSFGLDTLPSILQKLTVFLQQLPDDADPVVYNQDLVGFFTSIPVFRILNAVR